MAGPNTCQYCLRKFGVCGDTGDVVAYTTDKAQAERLAHDLYQGMSNAKKGATSFILIGGGRSEILDGPPAEYFEDMEWVDRCGLKIRLWDWQRTHEARVLAVRKDGDDRLYQFSAYDYLWDVLKWVEAGFSVEMELEVKRREGKVVG